MTRRPKTPRTHVERACEALRLVFGGESRLGFRRQPKGRRAKSGQWAKRTPCPVKLGRNVCECIDATVGESVREQRFTVSLGDETRVVIDEIHDDQFHDEGYSVGGVPVRTYRPETTEIDKFRYGAAPTNSEDFR